MGRHFLPTGGFGAPGRPKQYMFSNLLKRPCVNLHSTCGPEIWPLGIGRIHSNLFVRILVRGALNSARIQPSMHGSRWIPGSGQRQGSTAMTLQSKNHPVRGRFWVLSDERCGLAMRGLPNTSLALHRFLLIHDPAAMRQNAMNNSMHCMSHAIPRLMDKHLQENAYMKTVSESE